MSTNPVTRVLVIDADNVRRGMLACSLPTARFALHFAKTDEKGLDLLVRNQPDVVIVGASGTATDLCQRLRSLPVGMSCLLLLMDERFRDQSVGTTDAEAAGADSYLPFPFEAGQLEKQLELWVRRELGHATIPEAASVSTPLPSSALPPREGSAPPESAGWNTFAQRVGSFFNRLDSLDYYQLLELPRNATSAATKDAYFRCSMEFHPDRFIQLGDEALRLQIYEVYKRMSEAFKVLINSQARSQYDAALAGPERHRNLRYLERGPKLAPIDDMVSDAITAAGKKYLRFAILSQEDNNLRSARMYLTLALQCEPQNGALRDRFEALTRRLED